MELLAFNAADGIELHAALHTPSQSPPGDAATACDAVVYLHGAGSNFYSSTLLAGILPTLQQLGLPVLAINTRGHDSVCSLRSPEGPRRGGAAFETVDQCRHDVRGAVDLLAGRGYGKIALLGHSLGALKAIYSQAHDAHQSVAQIVAISPPQLSYAAFSAGPRRSEFLSTMSRAEQLVAAGEQEHLLNVTIPLPLLITAAGYVDKYGPAERYNLFKFADRLAVPIHYIFGELEISGRSEAFAGLDRRVRDFADQHGLSADVSVIPGAEHFYTGRMDGLSANIADWAKRQT